MYRITAGEQLTVGIAATASDAELAYFLGLVERHMWANLTTTDVAEKVIVNVGYFCIKADFQSQL